MRETLIMCEPNYGGSTILAAKRHAWWGKEQRKTKKEQEDSIDSKYCFRS